MRKSFSVDGRCSRRSFKQSNRFFSFKQLTIAGFRQARFRLQSVSESDKLIRPESGDILQKSPDSGVIVPDSGHSDRNLAGVAGFGQNAGSPAKTLNTGHLAGILDRSGCSGQIPATFAGICICQI
jgi:hypothetical protein